MPVQQQSGKKNKKGQETPKGPKTPGADTPQKKVLEGGVTIEEVKIGNGPVAKPGREVNTYFKHVFSMAWLTVGISSLI
jgi:FK506-binding nuclear protein